MQGVQVKQCYPLTIPERHRDASCGGATTFIFFTSILLRANRSTESVGSLFDHLIYYTLLGSQVTSSCHSAAD